MAIRNDYKLVAQKCKKQFENASRACSYKPSIVDSLSEEQKERFGFYFYVLQLMTGVIDYSALDECIVDTDYNGILYDNRYNDEGVDAVFFDEDNHHIFLFNFKYRKSFNPDKSQSENETILTTKFLSMISNDTNSAEGKLRTKLQEIISKNESSEIWETTVYVVSNENIPLDVNGVHISNLGKDYGVEFRSLALDDLSQMDSPRPEPIKATCILPFDYVIPFKESDRSSNVSYIIKMPLVDIVRMTCNNKNLRDNYSLDDDSQLAAVGFEMSCLYDNVRGYVLKSTYNSNIFETLRAEPSRFFFYNNGITIVAKDIVVQEVNMQQKLKITFDDLQVLNGGQTLRTIHRFNSDNPLHISKYIAKGQILVRALKVNDDEFKHNISEYTNSQNAITSLDLKATRLEQLHLEEYLAEHDILYIRKSGDAGLGSVTRSYSIGIMRLGQLLFSAIGHPEAASNKRREIFGKFYNELFAQNDNLLSEHTIDLIYRFRNVEQIYRSTSYRVYEQKIFYIIYLTERLDGPDDISCVIDRFEDCIHKYCDSHSATVAESRVLIRRDFKNYLDQYFDLH